MPSPEVAAGPGPAKSHPVEWILLALAMVSVGNVRGGVPAAAARVAGGAGVAETLPVSIRVPGMGALFEASL